MIRIDNALSSQRVDQGFNGERLIGKQFKYAFYFGRLNWLFFDDASAIDANIAVAKLPGSRFTLNNPSIPQRLTPTVATDPVTVASYNSPKGDPIIN